MCVLIVYLVFVRGSHEKKPFKKVIIHISEQAWLRQISNINSHPLLPTRCSTRLRLRLRKRATASWWSETGRTLLMKLIAMKTRLISTYCQSVLFLKPSPRRLSAIHTPSLTLLLLLTHIADTRKIALPYVHAGPWCQVQVIRVRISCPSNLAFSFGKLAIHRFSAIYNPVKTHRYAELSDLQPSSRTETWMPGGCKLLPPPHVNHRLFL